jgi:hypothetical protein
VARLGGAELAVLLPGVPRGHAQRWADRLRDAMTGGDIGATVNVRTPDQKPTGRHAPDNITTTTMPAVPAQPASAIPAPAPPPAAIPAPAAPNRREDARSVLARLGVEVHGSGGRRRAADAPPPQPAPAIEERPAIEEQPANGHRRQPISLPSMDWLSELRLSPPEGDPILPPAPLPPPAPPPLPSPPLVQSDPEPTPPAPPSNPPPAVAAGKHSNRLGDLLMEALLAYRTASEPENPRHAAIGSELADDRDTAPRWRLPPWD